jgi:hypothetical protein
MKIEFINNCSRSLIAIGQWAKQHVVLDFGLNLAHVPCTSLFCNQYWWWYNQLLKKVGKEMDVI